MSKSYSVKDAAEVLGMTRGMVRHRLINGDLRGRKIKARRGQGYEWRVILNGEPPPEPEQEEPDPLEQIADQIIVLGKRFKRAIKHHDEKVRQQAIQDFATTLAETVQKGR